MRKLIHRVLAIAAMFVAFAGGAKAQTASEFYKDRRVQLIVGHEVGNDYDVGARLLAKHLARQLPGQAAVVVQNMPQAAALAAANHLYVRALRDGGTIGSISRNLPSQALMGLPNIEADPRRFNWLGATSFPGRVCAASTDAPVKSAKDLFTTELITGGVGVGSATSIVPTVLNRVLGTKFKMIEGYRGGGDVLLAIERGEVHGVCMSLGQFRSHLHKFAEGKMRFLLRAEDSPLPGVPDVPSIYDLASSEQDRQLMRFIFSSAEFGRPYLLPPDTPRDRVLFMREAFAAAVGHPELVAEAERMKLDMVYRAPERLEALIAQLYATPPELIETAKKISPNLR